MPEFMSTFPLNGINGKNGTILTELYDGLYSKGAVAFAGDVNGDGFSDIATDEIYTYSGHNGYSILYQSFLILGQAEVPATVSFPSLFGNNSSLVDAGDFSKSAGDVDGDGASDLVVNHGSIVFGSRDGSILGRTSHIFADAAAIGDINGDHCSDLLVADQYVVFGNKNGLSQSLWPRDVKGAIGFHLDHPIGGAKPAGDVNGDGFGDLILGDENFWPHGGRQTGTAFVVFGGAHGFDKGVEISSLDGHDGFRLSGVARKDHAGCSVASAGDVNADGIGDIVVGARDALGKGAAYVVFGKAGDFDANLDLKTLNGLNGFRLVGATDGAHAGSSVGSAGDVNGDGFGDVVVAAPQAGTAYIVFGHAGKFAASLDLGSLDGDNGFEITEFGGVSVESAGNVNGDGFGDVLFNNSASAVWIFGHRAAAAVVRSGTTIGNSINGGRGADSVAGLGGDDTLAGWESADTLTGGAGDDRLDGGLAADRLDGGNGSDLLKGSTGNDLLQGGAASDTLSGGVGNDHLVGDSGTDMLAGGAGADRFGWSTKGQSGLTSITMDVVLDFSANIDKIDVSAIDARQSTTSVNESFEFIGNHGFTAEGQIRVLQQDTGTLLLFNTGGRGQAEFAILLHNMQANNVDAQDFIL